MKKDYYKGKGAQLNTSNPFSKTSLSFEHEEGIDEDYDPRIHRQVFFESPKQIVNKVNSPDVRMSWSVNPYQGCEHGCIYCYARNTHEYYGFSAGLDFETRIIVKKNAPQLLEKKFLSRSWKPAPIGLSGNTDCYQPIEKEMRLTRQLLEVCAKYRNPVGIITKNALVQRDKDILRDLASEGLVHVHFSITSMDEKLRQKLEPRTATALKKLAVMEEFSREGIPCSVMIAPIIPALNDHEIPEIMKRIAEAGALSAGYTVVRLNGRIGEIFEDWVKKTFPDRSEKIINRVRDLHDGAVNDSEFGRRMKGTGHFSDMIRDIFRASKKRYLGEKELPPYNLNAFREGGTYRLF